MWEGSNEAAAPTPVIDQMYDNFVDAVYAVDKSRLICPVSHLYYGGGIYNQGKTNVYYNDDGTMNEVGEPCQASYGWKDEKVVRSAHTYALLLGYGCPWRSMVTQEWQWQDELLNSKKHAYIVSEFAITGRQNPNTPESQLFINKDSYEFMYEESSLGYVFSDEEWELSQAFQALCTGVTIRQLYKIGVDGMIWCCLQGGANNGSYLKPILDFYGYKKQAFYVMQELFQEVVAFSADPDVLVSENYRLTPMIKGLKEGQKVNMRLEIVDDDGGIAFTKEFGSLDSDGVLPSVILPKLGNGYYKIRYILTNP